MPKGVIGPHLQEPEVHGPCLVGKVGKGALGATLVEGSSGVQRDLQEGGNHDAKS